MSLLTLMHTNNTQLLEKSSYTGLQQKRVRGKEYDDFLQLLVQANQPRLYEDKRREQGHHGSLCFLFLHYFMKNRDERRAATL